MPKASEVATELRKLADALEKAGEVEVERPLVSFYSNGRKHTFLNLLPFLPRPLKKVITLGEWGEMQLEHQSTGAWIRNVVYCSVVCKLVKPAQDAEYECEPLLSQVEGEEVASAEAI